MEKILGAYIRIGLVSMDGRVVDDCANMVRLFYIY